MRFSWVVALVVWMPAIAQADCIDDAGSYAGVSSTLLRAIAQHESGMRADAVNRNTNGTEDIGLMQINSSWLPKLAREGITRTSLFDACINAYVGAWILSSNFAHYGPTWDAVGAYNAVSPGKRMQYATQIFNLLRGEAR
jgi:soluble lytic murein transglycosylase-like protein